MLLLEFRLQRNAVRAASDDRGADFVEFLFCVPKLGRLVGSARRQRLRKKIKNDVLTVKIRERHFASVVRRQPEQRRLVSFF